VEEGEGGKEREGMGVECNNTRALSFVRSCVRQYGTKGTDKEKQHDLGSTWLYLPHSLAVCFGATCLFFLGLSFLIYTAGLPFLLMRSFEKKLNV
jgi:hypothetical protein